MKQTHLFPALCLWALAIGCCLPAVAAAADAPEEHARAEYFEKHIRPLLVAHCEECHGEEQQENDLRVDGRDALLRGGQRGAAVVPGDVGASLLFLAVSGRADEELKMPPEGEPLSEEQLALLDRWIRDGAHWGEEKQVATKTPTKTPIERLANIRSEHWAYRPIRKPPLPEHAPSAWPRNAIDQFVLARLEKAGLEPSPEADRRTLMRRAYFDLIGLPPSYEALEAFAADTRENAYELLVEQLLARPEYGQRWGRHWLDVARYSDTRGQTNVPGTEVRFPFAWTYRDYVIRALNEDRPYDRFLTEQLAGDTLELIDREDLAGLGFLTVGKRFLNRRHRILGERIDLVSRGLMGITIVCAKCHDHKFDPFSMQDYYALYGIFESSAEPMAIELPEIGPPHSEDPAMRKALEAELAPALEEWAELVDELIEEDLQAEAESYLALAAADAAGIGRADVATEDDKVFANRGVAAWRAVLDAEDGPLARFWRPLRDLEEENFSALAGERIESDHQSNRIIREALLREKPASLVEAGRVIGRAIGGVYARWKKLQQIDPGDTAFTDPASEEIRSLLTSLCTASVPQSGTQQAGWFLGRVPKPLAEKNVELEKILIKYRDVIPMRAMALLDSQLPRDAAIHVRGNPEEPGKSVRRQCYELFADACEAAPVDAGSGRAELARWITHAENPLTMRVIVNRIWGWHFGRHLVATPSDFGTRTAPPTHPALLDYLADSLRERGWSLKALHRLIMQSATYRQTSATRAAAGAIDPENRLLWRMNRRRLEFEPMRDAMLAATGELDRRLGGPPFDDIDAPRRSVYLLHDRRSMAPVLPTFDVPVADATLSKRSETTVPQQALYLMNNGFVMRRASRLAAQLADKFAGDALSERVGQLYRWIYRRDPSAEELADTQEFLAQTADAFRSRPASSTELSERDACWSLGSGTFDAERGVVADFRPLVHFDGRRWWPSPARSASEVMFDAVGGRPGADRAAVRRWHAPEEAGDRYLLRGTFETGRFFGDGLDLLVLSSRVGLLKKVSIDALGPVDLHVENLKIEPGDHIDLVVFPRGDNAFDDFSWSPRIVEVGQNASGQPYAVRQWRSDHAFRRSIPVWEGGLDPWEQLAQVLLISNEFMFVD